MSGVELILAAMAAGAGAGTTSVTSSAVQDAYNILKEGLVSHLGGRERAQRLFDGIESESSVWEVPIGEKLKASGVEDDEAVIAAAKDVLALVNSRIEPKYQVDLRNAQGVHFGSGSQTNTWNNG